MIVMLYNAHDMYVISHMICMLCKRRYNIKYNTHYLILQKAYVMLYSTRYVMLFNTHCYVI